MRCGLRSSSRAGPRRQALHHGAAGEQFNVRVSVMMQSTDMSCGAAGMNLLLAAHALGYVAGWITGWQAYSEHVRAAFCEPGERIAGFIFIGHPGAELIERPRPDLAAVHRRWAPPQDPQNP